LDKIRERLDDFDIVSSHRHKGARREGSISTLNLEATLSNATTAFDNVASVQVERFFPTMLNVTSTKSNVASTLLPFWQQYRTKFRLFELDEMTSTRLNSNVQKMQQMHG